MKKLLLTLICVLVFTSLAYAEGFIGTIKTITGKGYIVRGGELNEVAVGAHILLDDTLVTVKNSTMGVIFKDNTQLALGAETEMLIDEYVFDPVKEDVGFLAQMRTGTALYVSGKIAQLKPEKVKVKTPLTTIGIRGTKFVVTVPKQED